MPITQSFEKRFLSSPLRLGRKDHHPFEYLKHIHSDRALIKYKPVHSLPIGFSFLYVTFKAVGLDIKKLGMMKGLEMKKEPVIIEPCREDALFSLAQETLDYIHSQQETAEELYQLESKLQHFVQTKLK
ncbi:unnamed protein product [Rhizopus stolonifer]